MLTDTSQGDFGVVRYVAWALSQKVIPEEGCGHHQILKFVVLALMVGGRGQGNTYRILKNGDTICDSATVGRKHIK